MAGPLPLPPSLAVTPNIPLKDQTDEQVRAERDYWLACMGDAPGFASANAARGFAQAAQRELNMRERLRAATTPMPYVHLDAPMPAVPPPPAGSYVPLPGQLHVEVFERHLDSYQGLRGYYEGLGAIERAYYRRGFIDCLAARPPLPPGA